MDHVWKEAGWERLAPGVARYRLPGWDATVGIVVGEEGVLLVDAGSTLREGAWLRQRIEELLGRLGSPRAKPRGVTHLVLTHPHFDHVLGAAVFAGAAVYGAVGLDARLAAEREALYEDAVRHGVNRQEAAEAVDVLVRPRHPVSGDVVVDLGGREAVLANVGPGHTAYDLAVLVPGRGGDPSVVFCGDLVEESGEPQVGPDAVPARWPAAIDRLLSLGGDAVYVPGHGAVVGAGFVREQREELARRFAGLRG
jgi:glyoxylase-like metal-dependent hydrolase (beta-lactamase superfamily II)